MSEETAIYERPISLIIPGKPEYIGLCRLVTGVVGAHELLDEEVIADLKLAISEACTCFLWGPEADSLAGDVTRSSGPVSLQIDFDISPDVWEIAISDPRHAYRLPPLGECSAMSEESLRLTIINALVDSMEQLESGEGGSRIRLVKKLHLEETLST